MKKSLDTFRQIADSLLSAEQTQPVAPYIPVKELYEKLDLQLGEAVGYDAMTDALQEIVLATPKTGSNAFFNQLFGGRNDKAVLGELLSVLLNNSMYTYKAGGPMIGIEKEIIRNIASLIGWDEMAEGTLAPGGSMTNLMGMLMARDQHNKDIRYKGVQEQLMVYTSEASHYSTPKNAAFAGIGRDQVSMIRTNSKGEMDVDHLQKVIVEDIEKGLQPVLVNATSATTVLGAYDPLDSIADICEQYNIWLHVDAAYGGSVMFSDKYKHLIQGAHRANSFSINAHKMLGTPLSCSIILARNGQHLHDTFSNDASYLYQTHDDDMNPGKISMQCGRRNDALKFWTLWKSVGTKGLGKIVDQQFALADHARDYIRANDDYQLYSFDDTIGICFNYKNYDPIELCNQLYLQEQLMVGYGSFNGDTFIRLVTVNYNNEMADIDKFFQKLETFADTHMK